MNEYPALTPGLTCPGFLEHPDISLQLRLGYCQRSLVFVGQIHYAVDVRRQQEDPNQIDP